MTGLRIELQSARDRRLRMWAHKIGLELYKEYGLWYRLVDGLGEVVLGDDGTDLDAIERYLTDKRK